MIHLRKVEHKPVDPHQQDLFPHNLPIIKTLKEINFSSEVTFFVGENGSGKSTLLETIACAAESITVGSEGVKTDPTLRHIRPLSRDLKLIWNKRTKRGFFLRAEDFFAFSKKMAQIRQEMENELKNIEETYKGRSEYAKDYARMPYLSEINSIRHHYGEDGLDAHSHGESFLALFQQRFVPDGLYLLDEPEAALSPMSQLGLISLLKQMIEQNGQFIIATHSPILMAFPGARIISFDQIPIQETKFEDLESVSLMKDFLINPGIFLRHL